MLNIQVAYLPKYIRLTSYNQTIQLLDQVVLGEQDRALMVPFFKSRTFSSRCIYFISPIQHPHFCSYHESYILVDLAFYFKEVINLKWCCKIMLQIYEVFINS